MKFADLVTELRSDIWPEGVPESLTAPIDKSFEAAVTHLQRYIPCLQTRNINRYAQCSTYFQGGKTVIDAPKGRIKKLYTILNTPGEEIYPAVFKQVTKEELDCNSLNLLSMIYPPRNANRDILPMGFKYPEEDSDYKVNSKGEKLTTKHGRAVIGQWAIDRDRIYISPWINSNELVVVEWDGVKTKYSPDDITIEDVDFKRAVRLFVQREYARDFDNDYERYRYMSADFDMAMGDLIHECKKQTELNTTFYCPESYDIIAERRDKKFNELKASSVVTTAAEAAVTSYEFAVIGNAGASVSGSANGYDGTNAAVVAELVKSWSPEFIITTGDNSMNDSGAATTGATQYDTNIGQHYSDYIFPYGSSGLHGRTSTATADTGNRFFPSIGDRDITDSYGTTDAGLSLWKSYFNLPGNEEYYTFEKGVVKFFCLFSNLRYRSDYNGSNAAIYNSYLTNGIGKGQYEWLSNQLTLSKQQGTHWNVVYFHHSPYTTDTGSGGSGETSMRWDFPEMGADVVITGQGHQYERITDASGFAYLNCGSSGAPLLAASGSPSLPNGYTSQKFYNAKHGAIRSTVDNTTLKFEFIDKDGDTQDTYTLTKKLTATKTTRTAS